MADSLDEQHPPREVPRPQTPGRAWPLHPHAETPPCTVAAEMTAAEAACVVAGWAFLLAVTGGVGGEGGSRQTCPDWRAGGSYFYYSPTPSYLYSCPHISCLSTVRNSWPISVLARSFSSLSLSLYLSLSLSHCLLILSRRRSNFWFGCCHVRSAWIQRFWNCLPER